VGLTVEEAKDFHSVNIEGLAAGGAELIQALTMNYDQEAAQGSSLPQRL